MLRIFRRSTSPPAPSSPKLEAASFDMKALPILSAKELLAHCGYDEQLSSLFRAFGLSEPHFDMLVRRPVHRFAEAVQLAPASENNHHCGPGGLLKHTLEVITAALQIRRGYQLPIGGSPDVMAQEEHFWTYGVFVSCLLHDIGKVLRSEEHTSELQSRGHLVCRLLLEKKKSLTNDFESQHIHTSAFIL